MNEISQNKNTCKGRRFSRVSGRSKRRVISYLVSELAQASRHRVFKFTQVFPKNIISCTHGTKCVSTHFMAAIIGGGPR